VKVLIDPCYTQRVRICSSSFLGWELVEELCRWRSDVFCYMVLPDFETMEPADWEWVNARPYRDRVQLVQVPTNRVDRTGELYMLREGLHEALHPLNRVTWDIDVVVSSRIPVLKHMMVHSSRPGGKFRSPRMFVGMEDMPCMPFRGTVPWYEHEYGDTLMSYALSDGVIFNGMWMKKTLKPTLREVFAPAWQKRILDNIHEANSVKLERLQIRDKDHMYDGQDFNVGFVGRMTGTRNFEAVAELFRKQFSYPLGPNKAKMKFGISTNSQSTGAGDPGEIDFIDLQMNDRPEFYAFLQNQHVVVNLSSVEDFSMSTYETLRHGVPMIVEDKPWTEFLGPDYPFRVKNQTEAYAVISAFAANYVQMYSLFAAWEATWWKSYVENPGTNVTTGETLIGMITEWEQRRADAFLNQGAMAREWLQSIAQLPDELDLGAKAFENIPKGPQVTTLALGRVPSTLVWKIIAQEFGYRDTGKTGIVRKV
jgi:hypothetical protein